MECMCMCPLPVPARQRMQEKVKDIDRKKGDAIEQERLERIRADFGIAAYKQSTDGKDRIKTGEDNRRS